MFQSTNNCTRQVERDLSGPHVASEEEKWPDVPYGSHLQTTAEALYRRGTEGARSGSCEDSDPEEELQPGQHVAQEEEERSSDLPADQEFGLMLNY